jgi:hypothetical protein
VSLSSLYDLTCRLLKLPWQAEGCPTKALQTTSCESNSHILLPWLSTARISFAR